MKELFSQMPKDLPPWAWLLTLLIFAVLTYVIVKANKNSKKQNNNMSGNTINNSTVTQRNIDKES